MNLHTGSAAPTADGRPTTDDRRPTTADGRPTTDDGRPPTADGRPTTADGRRTTDDGRPTNGSSPPRSSNDGHPSPSTPACPRRRRLPPPRSPLGCATPLPFELLYPPPLQKQIVSSRAKQAKTTAATSDVLEYRRGSATVQRARIFSRFFGTESKTSKIEPRCRFVLSRIDGRHGVSRAHG